MSIAHWLFLVTFGLLGQLLEAAHTKRLPSISEERRAKRPLINHEHTSSLPAPTCAHSCTEYLKACLVDNCIMTFCNCVYFPFFALLACCEHCGYLARPEAYWKEKHRAAAAKGAIDEAARNGETK
ncbi:hypothetical protein FJ365_00075 [Candidatus Dependentiae bacterium]|nr:hypothetical protein [Candidatus Dependentiae bacterium]